jgi:SAM-dependent methyltransferase
MNAIETLRDRTITDFGEQWTQYQDIGGYFGSLELLKDFFGEVLDVESLRGARVADVGSGNGRIVRMLLAAGADHVTAIEPSTSFDVMQENLRIASERVTMLRVRGDEIPADGHYDAVFSVGVIHHIPEPMPVIEAAYRALRPGGTLAIWIYGREGNRLYLSIAMPLRVVTSWTSRFALISAPVAGSRCRCTAT